MKLYLDFFKFLPVSRNETRWPADRCVIMKEEEREKQFT
jgi:hypothetical protein